MLIQISKSKYLNPNVRTLTHFVHNLYVFPVSLFCLLANWIFFTIDKKLIHIRLAFSTSVFSIVQYCYCGLIDVGQWTTHVSPTFLIRTMKMLLIMTFRETTSRISFHMYLFGILYVLFIKDTKVYALTGLTLTTESLLSNIHVYSRIN